MELCWLIGIEKKNIKLIIISKYKTNKKWATSLGSHCNTLYNPVRIIQPIRNSNFPFALNIAPLYGLLETCHIIFE